MPRCGLFLTKRRHVHPERAGSMEFISVVPRGGSHATRVPWGVVTELGCSKFFLSFFALLSIG